MDIKEYLNKLKNSSVSNIDMAKERFFSEFFKELTCVSIATRNPLVQQLTDQNICFTYTNNQNSDICFRLSNMKCMTFGNQKGCKLELNDDNGNIFFHITTFTLNKLTHLSAFISINEAVPKLLEDWQNIASEVQNICEENLKNCIQLQIHSDTNPQEVLQFAVEKLLNEYYMSSWPNEYRGNNTILSYFSKNECPFQKDPSQNLYFHDFGPIRVIYTDHRLYAVLEYKGQIFGISKMLTIERCQVLAKMVPQVYQTVFKIIEDTQKQEKLRSINKNTMKSLIESKMQKLSLEYVQYQWDGRNSSNGKGWFNEKSSIGIELKVKCKNRRCLTFHVRYEKMEQFLKILDELPKTIETVNSLPFNALVSIYGNDVKWKKPE